MVGCIFYLILFSSVSLLIVNLKTFLFVSLMLSVLLLCNIMLLVYRELKDLNKPLQMAAKSCYLVLTVINIHEHGLN